MNAPNASDIARADRFGRAVARHLEAGAATLHDDIAQRLAASRRVALAQLAERRSRRVPLRRFALAGWFGGEGSGGIGAGTMLAATALLLAGMLFAVDLAGPDDDDGDSLAIDTEILTDDLPFTAHLDPVFPHVLQQEQQNSDAAASGSPAR